MKNVLLACLKTTTSFINKKVSLPCLLLVALTSCNPIYVIRTAYQGTSILLRRHDIKELILKSDLPKEKRARLKLVLETRQFASEIGLTAGESYTTYSEIDREAVSWVILASKNDSFELHTWWFPIVGRLPYKGYFNQEEALQAEEQFDAKRYDTIVRPVEAYSTLGWFNDPLLSTTLQREPISIVELVLHELTHNTIWLKGQIDFNESLATYIGNEGAVDFFRAKAERCLRYQTDCQKQKKAHQEAINYRDRILDLSLLIEELYDKLDQVYKSDLPHLTKLDLREEVFNKFLAPLRRTYPNLKILKNINNAEIMQLRLYLTNLNRFRELFIGCRDWPSFLNKVKTIKNQVESGQITSPYDALPAYAP